MEKVPLLLAAEPHHEQPKSLDAKRYPSTKSVHCFEWYAISKTEVAIREGIIMEKQALATLATITAISVAIITPTSALADGMKYNQAVYEEIGMDRSEVIDWVQDPKRNVYGKTEDETMQYLIASTKEEQTSNIRMDTTAARGSWSNQWFAKRGWIARNGMWSLSLQPTWWAATATPTRYYYAESAWATVPPQFSSSRHWTAYPTASKMMKEQFDCHVRYGNLKTPYNLEPSRTSISQITCN